MAKPRRKLMVAKDIGEIPVYPEFARVHWGGSHIPADAPICEEDDGSVCFVSEAEKKRYMKKVYNKRCAIKGQMKEAYAWK